MDMSMSAKKSPFLHDLLVYDLMYWNTFQHKMFYVELCKYITDLKTPNDISKVGASLETLIYSAIVLHKSRMYT